MCCGAVQRDVEIEIETVDKGGTFLGTVVLPGPKPVNLGLALLRAGLAKLQPFFSADRVKGGSELAAAEAAAKEARLKVSRSPGCVCRAWQHEAGMGSHRHWCVCR